MVTRVSGNVTGVKQAVIRRMPGSRYSACQTGALTIFTAIMILMLMLLLMLYASRVGIFEQRVSANDMRQKQAFRAAETGIAITKKFFVRNANLVLSTKKNIYVTGNHGWMADGTERWHRCADSGINFDTSPAGSHPCYGETDGDRRLNSWYYEWDDPDVEGEDTFALPLDTTGLIGATEQVTIGAILCVLDISDPEDVDCLSFTDPADPGGDGETVLGDSQFMITVLSRGESDCEAGDCRAEALITVPLANFSALNGPPPSVPLTTKSSYTATGTMEVVTNPNAGGVGVPLSVWAKTKTAAQRCGYTDATLFDAPNGTWQTCYPEDWYNTPDIPDDGLCGQQTGCACVTEVLSYPNTPGEPVRGVDMFWDDDFPCSLFQYYFGVPDSQHAIIKNASQQILTDCSTLDADSFGIIWIDKSGSTCTLNGPQVGSLENPVVLVSQVDLEIKGNLEFFGVIYVYDYPDLGNKFFGGGTAIVYGAIIVDTKEEIDNFTGTTKLVYNRTIISRAHDGGGSVGEMMGGWTDFPRDWR